MRNTMIKHVRVAGAATLSIAASLALFACGGAPASNEAESAASQEQTQESGTSSTQEASSSQKASSSGTSGASTGTKMSDDGRLNLLVLVNEDHAIPDDWDDSLELQSETNIRGDSIEVDKITLKAFKELQEDLKENEGITIELNSGYRSVAEQQRIWDEFMADYGEDYVKEYVAVPGHSEHHTGLALDALLVVDGQLIETNEDIFAHQDTWDVIHSYLAKHGFILRFPEDAEDITKVKYEPWHFRYVGVEDATAIAKKGITLEEYLGDA